MTLFHYSYDHKYYKSMPAAATESAMRRRPKTRVVDVAPLVDGRALELTAATVDLVAAVVDLV